MTKTPMIFLSVFFLCLGVSFALWAAQVQRVSKPGGVMVSASIAEPSNLIPALSTDSASQEVVGKVFNGLLKYGPDLELTGDLAQSWEVQDEGKTFIFHLRKHVLWHDLQPFTARDVEFTFKKLTDPEVPTPYGGDFLMVSRLVVVDDYTVRVEYEHVFSPALASWTMWIMPRHALENENLRTTSFSRNPIGTGPYRFKKWIDGERVELEVFESYFEGRPNLDRVVMRVIPDSTTMFLELHQQTIDMMGLTPIQFTRLSDSKFFETNFNKFRYPSFGYTYLGYNLTHPFFKEKKVRQALNLAIDKQEIIQGVLLGLGRECTGPFTPESWAYNTQVKPAAFNPQEAKRLLEEAGWSDHDQDGVLDRDGVRFEFTVMTNQANVQRKWTAEIIQRRLRQIGIVLKIKIVEWSVFIHEFIDKRDFDAVLLGWGLARDPDPFDIWHSSKTGPGEFNFLSYKNSRVDELIVKGRSTFNLEERKKAYNEIHKILYDEQPVIFLYVPDATPIVHRRFKNLQPTAIGLGYNFIDWEVPSDERKYTRYLK
jgi:peptide/nickel transport system substrate-binding protein